MNDEFEKLGMGSQQKALSFQHSSKAGYRRTSVKSLTIYLDNHTRNFPVKIISKIAYIFCEFPLKTTHIQEQRKSNIVWKKRVFIRLAHLFITPIHSALIPFIRTLARISIFHPILLLELVYSHF